MNRQDFDPEVVAEDIFDEHEQVLDMYAEVLALAQEVGARVETYTQAELRRHYYTEVYVQACEQEVKVGFSMAYRPHPINLHGEHGRKFKKFYDRAMGLMRGATTDSTTHSNTTESKEYTE